MKAVFDWPYDVPSNPGLAHVAGFKLKDRRYILDTRWRYRLTIDCTHRLITIEGPETSRAPWTTLYEACAEIVLGKRISSNTEVAKRWFRKLRVVEHISERSDRHPVDAGPRDNYETASITIDEITYGGQCYGYTNKRDFLTVMGQIYDRIQSKLKRATK